MAPARNPSHPLEIPAVSQLRFQNHQLFYATLPDRQRSSPMSTPTIREVPPPPLPPPRWVEDMGAGRDAGWEFENQDNANAGRLDSNSMSIKPGSSLLGGYRSSPTRGYSGPQKQVDLEPSNSQLLMALGGHKSDESDSASKDMRIPDLRELLEYNKLQSEKQMGQQTLERSSQAYDKQLLSRIGGSRGPQPRAEPTINEDAPVALQAPSQKSKGPMRPLATQERRQSEIDVRSPHAPSGWAPATPGGAGAEAGPPTSVASPHFSGVRSPLRDQTQQQRTTMKHDESAHLPARLIHRDSYDHGSLSEHEYVAHSPAMHHSLELSPAGSDDYQQSRTGQKRRAQSPPNDSSLDPRLPGGSNSADAWGRRQLQTVAGRNLQPPARFQTPSSLSSNGSANTHNASFPSSYALSNPSTATRYSSDRSSPNNSYPPVDAANISGPQISLPGPAQVDTTKAPPIPQRRPTASSLQRAPGLWICDCCPKKPKKFESEDELRIHEMEKQYICQYCHNRFKNKNEAERHQNSLHLRRYSWSCAALTSFEAAFHSTPGNSVMASIQGPNYNSTTSGSGSLGSYPGLLHSTPTDTCGYCGQEFVNPPNWDDRVEHLNHVHKFGECNQSKKFFRADHFRQHLKHSHAGTSGKWTNMLENACMKDEPPPIPINHQQHLPPGMPGITMVGQQQLLVAAAAAAAAGVGQGSMSGYGSPGMSQSGLGSPSSNNMTLNSQMGLGLMSMEQPAGQQAIMNATGPMGDGGPGLAPIASMMGVGQHGQYSMVQSHQQHGHGPDQPQ